MTCFLIISELCPRDFSEPANWRETGKAVNNIRIKIPKKHPQSFCHCWECTCWLTYFFHDYVDNNQCFLCNKIIDWCSAWFSSGSQSKDQRNLQMCEVTQLNTISIVFISCGTSWKNCVFSQDFIIITVHRPFEDTLYKLNKCSYLKTCRMRACVCPYWSNSSLHQLMFMGLVIAMNVVFNQQVKATLKEHQVQCEQILLWARERYYMALHDWVSYIWPFLQRTC